MNEFLQIVNILLTTGVLFAVIVAAVKYGELKQEVKNHGDRLTRVEDHVYPRGDR